MNSSSSILESCLTNSTLSLQCLVLKRQLAEVKQRREQAKKRFEETRRHHEMRQAECTNYFNNLMFNDTMLQEYVHVLRSKCQLPLPLHVLQQNAKLYKYVRHEELLSLYLRLLEQHNTELIQDMEKTKKNMIIGLMKKEEDIDIIMDEMIELVATQVQCNKGTKGLLKSLRSCSRRRIPDVIEILRS